MLQEFYVVTATSVYHVEYDKKLNQAKATKIDLRGKSKVDVGQELTGPMVSVCKWLQFYIPEGGGITSFQRKIEMVNTRYWLGGTSRIVGLFLEKQGALDCLNDHQDLTFCDQRWLDTTKKVICAIGHEHPVFEVCEWEGLRLVR